MEAVNLGRHYLDNPFATIDKKFQSLVVSSKGHLSSDCGHRVRLIGIHHGHFLHKGRLAENPVLLGLSGYTRGGGWAVVGAGEEGVVGAAKIGRPSCASEDVCR